MAPRAAGHWAFLGSSPPPTGLSPLCLCTTDIGPVMGWEAKLPGAWPLNTTSGAPAPLHSATNPDGYANCVATLQGQAGSWYLCRQKNIHRDIRLSAMSLFMGGRAMHAASCLSIYMSHVLALAPQSGIHHGTCPLACLSSSSPPAGSPYLFNY